MRQSVAILSLALILGACQQQNEAAAAQSAPAAPVAKGGALTPEQLGALGAEIRKDPLAATNCSGSMA